jgi:hypothetical protein
MSINLISPIVLSNALAVEGSIDISEKKNGGLHKGTKFFPMRVMVGGSKRYFYFQLRDLKL